MSDAGASPPGDSTGDAPPDLFGGTSGWDDPLPDLGGGEDPDRATGPGAGGVGTGAARPGPPTGDALPDLGGSSSADAPLEDLAGAASEAPLPDLGRVAVAPGDDDWAPVPLDPGDRGAEGLTDLTKRPRRSRRGAAARRAAVGEDTVPRSAGATPPRPAPAADAGGVEDPDPVGLDAPRGLATGGLAGGLEPGTLFGPDPGAAPVAGARRGGRKGRRSRRTGEDGAPPAPERPLTAEERLQHALKLAYAHLTKRDRTVSEVRTHLEKREVDEASIAGAIAELVEFRYLDDERYAARFVEDKRRLEGWGHLRIEQGLRRTGVPREVADRAVAEDPLRGDEATLAVQALEQRLAGQAPADDRARQKALRLLATKGYPLDTAYAAVRAYERRCAERDDG